MYKATCAVLIFGLLISIISFAQDQRASPEPVEPSFRLGIGAKLIRTLPFVMVGASYGSFSAQLGAGMAPTLVGETAITLFWYDLLVQYIINLPNLDFLNPYLGGGMIGVTGTSTISYDGIPVGVSVSALGAHAVVGNELRFRNLAVFFGVDWLLFTEMKVTGPGLSLSVPVALGGMGYHLGIRYDF